MAIIVAASLAALVGVVIGAFLANSTARMFTAGFAFLGLTSGLLVGLSSSPIIASVITAIFALIGSLLASYLATRPPGAIVLPPLSTWLAPLSCMTIVGVVGGITIRVNELLYFPPAKVQRNLRNEYTQMGFSQAEVNQIMAGHAAELAKAKPSDRPAPPTPPSPVALLDAEQKAKLKDVLKDAEAYSDLKERIAFIVQQVPAVKEQVDQMRGSQKSPQQILNVLQKMTEDKGVSP